jgi:hypothetical protein
MALADRWNLEHKGSRLPIGRGFNQLEIVDRTLDDGTPLGNISGSAAKRYRSIFPYYLTSPIPVLYPKGYLPMTYLKARYLLADRDATFMFSVFMPNLVDLMYYIQRNWETLVGDIRSGGFDESVDIDAETRAELAKVTKPDPARADELEKIFREGFDSPIIPRLWPQMSFICTIGTGGFAAYTRIMREFSGDIPIDFSIYGASEALMAACTGIEDPEFALLVDSCFFEFIPADAPDSCTDTLNIDQLEVGKEYELILTNLSGFYRYRIKDVIRVLGHHNTTPQITFAYRISQMVNLAAEKTTEEHLNHAVAEFAAAIGCEIYDYCLYIDYDSDPARYVLLAEPEHLLPVDRLEEYARIFEEKLCKANLEYATCRYDRSIGHPVVLLQQPQTHALWREFKIYKGSSPNQVKPVRVIDTPQKEKFFFGMLEEGSGRERLTEKTTLE